VPASAGIRTASGRVPAWSDLGRPRRLAHRPVPDCEAYPLADEDLYVGRLLRRRDDGQWLLFAFRNFGADGAFVGGITDGMPIGWHGDRLVAERP
jgi:beta-fructofuranosidase